MGTRINYVIKDAKSDEGVCAVIYSNNSHSTINPVDIFKQEARGATGPNSFLRKIMAITYPSDGGNHRKGEHVFSFDSNAGDNERLLLVYWSHPRKGSRAIISGIRKIEAVIERTPSRSTTRKHSSPALVSPSC